MADQSLQRLLDEAAATAPRPPFASGDEGSATRTRVLTALGRAGAEAVVVRCTRHFVDLPAATFVLLHCASHAHQPGDAFPVQTAPPTAPAYADLDDDTRARLAGRGGEARTEATS